MNDEQQWYRDAIIYELRIRSFYDADGDGIGDFAGLTQKLDYLADLGVTAIWMLPFYPSPLKDDGYDIADYRAVHPALGTLRDFKTLLKEAHRRGLKVVTELVLNHTSDQHAWFQRARRAPAGSRYRNWYVWSDDPTRYADARIIFQDFETSNWTWDPVAKAYFWHRFYSNQPDLNFDNPEVQKAMLGVVDHWLDLGVDGLRLDAVPYLYEREGTNCENLTETHDFLRKLRKHVDKKFKHRMLLAEANQWPEDAVAYFGKGDECHMCFHFPIMPRLFMALRMEDTFPVLDILEQTPQVPELCQWAIFLRNHDELTLEMVTDEERDYMVANYAADREARINLGIRRRLAPLLDNNRRRIELMNALLFSLPGTPVVYYGDEIGMGDNVYLGDRDGVRTPMQWSPDRNAGFSRANPQKLVLPVVNDPEHHFEAINVETQSANSSSLLWWMKRIIALRKQYRAFGRGSFEPLLPSNRRVLAFLRRFESEVILVVVNLSRFSQCAELDLSEFAGKQPVELFGNSAFPPVGQHPYLVMLGPHSFYWFSLSAKQGAFEARPSSDELPVLSHKGQLTDLFSGRAATALVGALEPYLTKQRWFRGKSRTIKSMRIVDSMPLVAHGDGINLVFVEVGYTRGDPELYVTLLAQSSGESPGDTIVARLRQRGASGQADTYLVDAARDPRVAEALLTIVAKKKRLRGKSLTLTGQPTRALKEETGPLPGGKPLGAEQTNTSFLYGDFAVGKLLRVLDTGPSIELEVLRHLERVGRPESVPELLGHIEVQASSATVSTLGIVQRFAPNQGGAWSLTVDEASRFFEDVMTHLEELGEAPPAPSLLVEPALQPSTEAIFGPMLHLAPLLGRRTAELHLRLATPGDDPQFKPDGFGALAKRAFYQSLRNLASQTIDALSEKRGSLEGETLELAQSVLKQRRALAARLDRVRDQALTGARIRVHGDYHLGQVLFTGKDFVILDFEGEPARSLAHRRSRRSPIADVAGMLRSLHYAAWMALGHGTAGVRPEDVPRLADWARYWCGCLSQSFVQSYLAVEGIERLVPGDQAALGVLLDAYLLEKALYEVLYELNNRPDWVNVPLRGVLDILT